MDPAVLAWALAQPAGSRAAVLASAYTGGIAGPEIHHARGVGVVADGIPGTACDGGGSSTVVNAIPLSSRARATV